MEPKRRLPVLKQTPEEEQGEEPRPPWHWASFGAVVTFAAWLPLAYLATAISNRLVASRLGDVRDPAAASEAVAALSSGDRARLYASLFLPQALAFVGAAVFGGFVVGRWGGDNAGAREAAVGGFAVGLVAVALTWAGAGFSWPPLVIVPLGAAACFAGGRLGVKRRIKARTPNLR